MDLLFKKYASPFLLLQKYIEARRFSEFVDDFLTIHNEDMIWEVWIHKIFDKDFGEYRETIMSASINKIKPNKKQIETTLIDSQNILNSFVPEN